MMRTLVALLFILSTSFTWNAQAGQKLSARDQACNDQLKIAQESLLAYDMKIGERWAAVFRHQALNPLGTVAEIAPGSRMKVGYGLARIGFRGKLYVVEPDPTALGQILASYRKILPHAEIIGVPNTLESAPLPTQIDALVANHPLDDMVLSELNLSPAQLEEIFSDSDSDAAFEASRRAWTQAQKSELQAAQRRVTATWKKTVQRTDPALVVVAQYESGYFKRQGFQLPDQVAGQVLRRLRRIFPARAGPLDARLTSLGQDPRRWLVAERRSNLDLSAVPSAFARLSPQIFVAHRLVADPVQNGDILFSDSSYLAGVGAEEWDGYLHNELALQIPESTKAATFEPGEHVGYADRQTDPLTFAMDGNAGSGRSLYFSRILNIKGLGRTLLATSKDPGHNNGLQGLNLAANEVIASNVLYTNLRTSSSPVTALTLKRNRNGELVRPLAAKLIRKDEDGSLDRPTHIFAAHLPQSRGQLKTLAEDLGRQDAEKFVERILHGAYSMGNTGIGGQMVDFETLHSVRGRTPVWSVSSRWPGNYFGLEHMGQLDLLNAFVTNELNVDHVTEPELREIFYEARRRQVVARFPDLMGASPLRDEYQWRSLGGKVEYLALRFERLSEKMYSNLWQTNYMSDATNPNMVFDFSRFMRWAPLYLRAGRTAPAELEALLFMPEGQVGPLAESTNYPNRVIEAMKPLCVSTPAELAKLKREARTFIRDYMALLKSQSAEDAPGFEARALLVNEDRAYMSPQGSELLRTAGDALAAGKINGARYGEILQWMIRASDRLPMGDSQIINVRISTTGASYREVRGFRSRQVLQDFGREPVVSAWQDNLELL